MESQEDRERTLEQKKKELIREEIRLKTIREYLVQQLYYHKLNLCVADDAKEYLHVKFWRGMWRCTSEECKDAYTELDTLRKHVNSAHGKTATVKKTKKLSRKEQVRQNVARLRVKNKKLPKRKARPQRIRDLFIEEEADVIGVHVCEDAILEVKQSNIPGAGNGVFAKQKLYAGDVVTWFAGDEVLTRTTDHSYTIGLQDGTFIEGIRIPSPGQGLASFINRKMRMFWENCEFVEYGGTAYKHRMYVAMTKDVAEGEELYISYGKGYRFID